VKGRVTNGDTAVTPMRVLSGVEGAHTHSRQQCTMPDVNSRESITCVDCEDTIDGDAIHCRRCVCPHTHARQQCRMPDVNSRESITCVDCEDTIDGGTIDGDAIDGDTIDGKS